MKKVLEYCVNLWYSIFRIRDNEEGKKTKMKTALMDARTLGAYIKNKYHEEYKMEISPIKLQKALYFCFAYWGGLIAKSKENVKYVEENLSDENEILFDNRIEAWVYGPVVPDVYREKNLESFCEQDPFNGNELLKTTIDDILSDLFKVGDFKLVSISHDDLCWQNAFDIYDSCHETEIKKAKIIDEYAHKECI